MWIKCILLLFDVWCVLSLFFLCSYTNGCHRWQVWSNSLWWAQEYHTFMHFCSFTFTELQYICARIRAHMRDAGRNSNKPMCYMKEKYEDMISSGLWMMHHSASKLTKKYIYEPRLSYFNCIWALLNQRLLNNFWCNCT